jgi:hypothetical protein
MIGLPEKILLKDLPVPKPELEALAGVYNPDEGRIENFARDGKLFFRLPSGAEGAMRRQSENVYAINENTEIHFVIHNGRVKVALVYTGGLLMDVARRVN